jgi:hypothetical protein
MSAPVTVVRVEEKSTAHLIHWLSDGRYILENRHSGAKARWSLWRPKVGSVGNATCLRTGSSLGQLLKWVNRNPGVDR